MERTRDSVTLSEIITALNEQDEEAAIAATQIESLAPELSVLSAAIYAALLEGAESARAELPVALQAEAFDVLEDAVQEWLTDNGGRMVSQISETSRQAIVEAIQNQLNGDGSARRAAQEIRRVIGLTARQQQTLERLRQSMAESGAVRPVIERSVAARADRMLTERANLIASQEAFNAITGGRQLFWEQLAARGALDPETLRQWITARDERVCPVCRPMHRQIRRLTQPFDLGGPRSGESVLTTPAHIKCRCSVVLINPRSPSQ